VVLRCCGKRDRRCFESQKGTKESSSNPLIWAGGTMEVWVMVSRGLRFNRGSRLEVEAGKKRMELSREGGQGFDVKDKRCGAKRTDSATND
jgi:hypothetical protein